MVLHEVVSFGLNAMSVILVNLRLHLKFVENCISTIQR